MSKINWTGLQPACLEDWFLLVDTCSCGLVATSPGSNHIAAIGASVITLPSPQKEPFGVSFMRTVLNALGPPRLFRIISPFHVPLLHHMCKVLSPHKVTFVAFRDSESHRLGVGMLLSLQQTSTWGRSEPSGPAWSKARQAAGDRAGLQLLVPDSQFSLHCTPGAIFRAFPKEPVVLLKAGPQPSDSGTVQEPSSFLVSLGKEQFERKINALFSTKKSWGTVCSLSEEEIEERMREMSKNRGEKRGQNVERGLLQVSDSKGKKTSMYIL